MVSSRMIFFLIATVVLFLFSGLGAIPFIWLSILTTLLSTSFIIYSYVRNKGLQGNMYLMLSFFILLLFLFISTFFFSLDRTTSIEKLMVWLSCYGIFIASSQIQIKDRFIFFIPFVLGVIFSLLLIAHFFGFTMPILSSKAYQMVLPTVGNHNHLGDIIGLIIALSTTFFLSGYTHLMVLYLFFPLLVLSFSKSAFLSLFITLICGLHIQKQKEYKHKIFFEIFRFIYFTIPIILIYSLEFSENAIIGPIQKFITLTFQVSPKPIFSSRDLYIEQVFQFITRSSPEQVGFGIGLGNFAYASSSTIMDMGQKIGSAHNIVLNLLVEGGIFSILWFLFFIIILILFGLKNRLLAVLPLIYIMINFQTDYTYQIPLMLFLLFFYSGQVNVRLPFENTKKNRALTILSVVIYLFAFSFTLHQFTVHEQKRIQITEYLSSLDSNEENSSVFSALQRLESEKPFDEGILRTIAIKYEERKNLSESIRILDKLSYYSPHGYIERLEKIINLLDKSESDSTIYLMGKKPLFQTFPLTKKETVYVNTLCVRHLNEKCL